MYLNTKYSLALEIKHNSKSQRIPSNHFILHLDIATPRKNVTFLKSRVGYYFFPLFHDRKYRRKFYFLFEWISHLEEYPLSPSKLFLRTCDNIWMSSLTDSRLPHFHLRNNVSEFADYDLFWKEVKWQSLHATLFALCIFWASVKATSKQYYIYSFLHLIRNCQLLKRRQKYFRYCHIRCF